MIWERLFEDGPRCGRSLNVQDGAAWRRRSWREVVVEAEHYAHGLRARGVSPGDVVGAILTNSEEAVAGLLGSWLAGAAVASLPVPARGLEFAAYGRQIDALAQRFDAPFVLTDDAIASALGAVVDGARGWSHVRGDGRLADAPPASEAMAFVQYSSGSTSAPKGCVLSARAIDAQTRIIVEMLELDAPPEEVVVSWLPLSHDMGLFGCLLPACAYGGELHLSSPERFIRAPRTWFRDCAEVGATITAGPNSALRLAARAARSSPTAAAGALRLKRIIVGAEQIQPETLEEVVGVHGAAGLEARAFMCAYGLAEATLAVTAIGVDEEPGAISVDSVALADGVVARVDPGTPGATRLVSVGRPRPGVSVSLCPGTEGALSEIAVRSPSLASGYFGDPDRTRERFVDGTFLTGDLGFLADGELYVVGRVDDMISINGRNVYAAEMEFAMASLGQIRRGCCTIVDVTDAGRTRLVALAELADAAADVEQLAASMSAVAARTTGVRLDECVFLAKGALPKTPSGKTQRYRSRMLATTASPDVVARVVLV